MSMEWELYLISDKFTPQCADLEAENPVTAMYEISAGLQKSLQSAEPFVRNFRYSGLLPGKRHPFLFLYGHGAGRFIRET